MDLRLDHDMLNACVQCGLCLTACPTYQVSGDESLSPRGRIALMRHVQDHDAPVTDDVLDAFDTCVQCRACEPACPSNVQFGFLMEGTRSTLASQSMTSPWWLRLILRPLGWPRLLRFGSILLGLMQRVVPLPKRLGLPRIPLRQPRLNTSGDDVYLFTGCVMDAWQREVHLAGQRVLEAAGFGVTPTGAAAPCCGALHTHQGLTDQARAMANKVIAALDGDGRPILVDSAGCGAAMKEYGHLLGTDQARAFAARVRDIQEFLAEHVDRLPQADGLDMTVAVQDPCHLRNVQRVHLATRTVLAPFVAELVELDDEGLCCGAGGAYSALQPDMAQDIRDRKLASIERAAPDLIASANPGCSLHLGNAGVATLHPMQIVDRALTRTSPPT
ncbi:MAG: heterodisulfide reductase-related iron-sulfur binding cluster [Nitriliruptoraceae bacterium]